MRALKTATARSQRPSRTASASGAQARGALGEVAVAEHEDGRVGFERAAQHRAGGEGRGAALADRALAAHHARAGVGGDLRRAVRRAVVGDDHLGAREARGERGERVGQAVGLLVGGDDDDRVAGHRGGDSRRPWRAGTWRDVTPSSARG